MISSDCRSSSRCVCWRRLALAQRVAERHARQRQGSAPRWPGPSTAPFRRRPGPWTGRRGRAAHAASGPRTAARATDSASARRAARIGARAAHCPLGDLARGSPQLVGNRSNVTLSHVQDQRGIGYPGSGVRRKVARVRPTSTSRRAQPMRLPVEDGRCRAYKLRGRRCPSSRCRGTSALRAGLPVHAVVPGSAGPSALRPSRPSAPARPAPSRWPPTARSSCGRP